MFSISKAKDDSLERRPVKKKEKKMLCLIDFF